MLIHELQWAIRETSGSSEWVVFLCPTDGIAAEYRKVLGVLLPQGSRFSGRTAIMGDRKYSIAAASDEVFVPPGTPFLLSWLGWGANSTAEASAWINQSAGMVTPSR